MTRPLVWLPAAALAALLLGAAGFAWLHLHAGEDTTPDD